MQTLRARPVLSIAIALLVVLLLTGAAYAIGRLTGYIPGVGIVDLSAPLRVLAEPVSQTREGVTLTVTEAVLSADKTVIFVKIEDVPADAYPEGELGGCFGKVDLKLSNGTLLEGGYISGGNWNSFESRLEYGAVPAQVNDAVLLVACIGGTMPGVLPENWEIPLRFAPAPPDMTVAPVIELSTPAVTNTPAAGVTSTPVLSNTMTRNGITLTLEKFVEVEGGYQLYGSLDLSGATLPAQGYFNTMGIFKMTDANGNRIPFEEAPFELQDNSVYDPNKVAWIYRTNQKAFAAPLTLSLSWVEMQIAPQIPFELDLGANPQIGQTWEINRDLTFEGHTVRLLSAQLVESTNPQWASFLKFTYEDKEGGIFINMMDAVPQKPLIEVTSGGGGGGPLTEIKFAWMNYGEIPSGLRRFTVSVSVPYRVNGPWQVVWNPPSTTEPIPTSAPEACLTSEKWEQVKGQHEALPAGLGGKILFTTDAMPPDINVFIANLDGSDPRGLVSDYYPSLSPDGTKVLFSTDAGLNVFDINSGQATALEGIWGDMSKIWSPDGTRILLYNQLDGLYVVNVDGTGLQKIETGSPRVNPIGWLPDNQTIVYGAQVGDIYNLYEHVFKTYNLQTGETKSLFPITIKTPIGAISPDGQWIAFNARLFGALDGAVFISRLDGSERKLIAMLDNAFAFHPVWSPNGQWLIVNVVEPYKPPSPILVNPFTCQSVRLENVRGEVQSWRP